MVIHPDGVYFGLPDDEYHADPALGSGDHKNLLFNPVQAQWKRLDALRLALGMDSPKPKDDNGKEEETTFQAFGKALHVLVLEGREKFDSLYAPSPDKPEGMLVTKDQLREALGGECDLPKSAALADHIRLAKLHKIGPLLADWEAMREEALTRVGEDGETRKLTEISKRWASTFDLTDRLLDTPRESRGGQSIRQKVLVNGQPEVSVIWTDDTGLRLKARFDYLRIPATVDLKTFSMRDGREYVDNFASSIHTFAYDVQAAHYQDARAQLGRLDRFNCPDDTWLDRVIATTKPAWVWLTVQTGGFPEIDTMQFPDQIVFQAAWQQVLEARKTHREYVAKFGEDQPWVADRPNIVLDDVCFNSSITGRGQPKWRP